MRSSVGIERNHPWRARLLDGLPQKVLGRIPIPFLAEIEVHRAPERIHRSVEIRPTCLHFDIRFVTAPQVTDRSRILVSALLELRYIALHPAQNRRVREHNTAFRHYFDQVTGAEFVAHIPANT